MLANEFSKRMYSASLLFYDFSGSRIASSDLHLMMRALFLERIMSLSLRSLSIFFSCSWLREGPTSMASASISEGPF